MEGDEIFNGGKQKIIQETEGNAAALVLYSLTIFYGIVGTGLGKCALTSDSCLLVTAKSLHWATRAKILAGRAFKFRPAGNARGTPGRRLCSSALGQLHAPRSPLSVPSAFPSQARLDEARAKAGKMAHDPHPPFPLRSIHGLGWMKLMAWGVKCWKDGRCRQIYTSPRFQA